MVARSRHFDADKKVINMQRSCYPIIAALVLLSRVPAFASDLEDPDWPCEQALVAEISAAVVWDGPSVDGLSDQWGSDPDVAALVQRLVARRIEPADAESLIEAFAGAQAPADRDHRLTLLFAGVLDVLNADRSKLNDGILRYARDQERRARALDDHLAELVRLEADDSQAADQRLEELQKRFQIEQRIFDDREKSIPFLCTSPRVVEQRIGDLARAIAAQLE